MKALQNGQPVEYLSPTGEWRRGKIHAINSHETADGFILGQTYLIDTGGAVREDVIRVDEKGKPLEVVRQPEQVLCNLGQIKPV